MNIEKVEPWLSAWRDLVRSHTAVTGAIERSLEEAELPATWIEVLLRLNRTPDGSMRMQELAAQLIFSRSGATRLVDRMEDAGLVRRESCDTDRRGTFAVITEAGREAAMRGYPDLLDAARHHFADFLTEEDVEDLRRVCGKLLAAYGLAEGEPVGTPRRV